MKKIMVTYLQGLGIKEKLIGNNDALTNQKMIGKNDQERIGINAAGRTKKKGGQDRSSKNMKLETRGTNAFKRERSCWE